MRRDHEVSQEEQVASFTPTEQKRIKAMRARKVAVFESRQNRKPTQDDHVAISMAVFKEARRRFGK